MPAWEIDHVLVFVEQDAGAAASLSKLGLAESFRRRHPGQGTSNVCFCFDDCYLELLWIDDAIEAAECPLSRSNLIARADWRRSGASPFGIALRSAEPEASLPFPCWEYAPDFLPDGMTIPVAMASDDPAQPLLFRSPGNRRPDQWTDGRAGSRQVAAGIAALSSLRLAFPYGVAPHPAFETLAESGLVSLATAGESVGAMPELTLELDGCDGSPRRSLHLPELALA